MTAATGALITLAVPEAALVLAWAAIAADLALSAAKSAVNPLAVPPDLGIEPPIGAAGSGVAAVPGVAPPDGAGNVGVVGDDGETCDGGTSRITRPPSSKAAPSVGGAVAAGGLGDTHAAFCT